jgi:hypothetical protein
VSRSDTLKSLEVVLESFLSRAVALKAKRLPILDGINRLDDIARLGDETDLLSADDKTDQIGGWFAEHQTWINDQTLRPADRDRISQILGSIRRELTKSTGKSAAETKIAAEIDRWQGRMASEPTASTVKTNQSTRKLVLRKGTESLDEASVHPSSEDSIALMGTNLRNITDLFTDLAQDRNHLMSILDDTLNSATLQKNREALLLSALIIYYLKQNGYMVKPFVRRLKEAERLHEGIALDA